MASVIGPTENFGTRLLAAAGASWAAADRAIGTQGAAPTRAAPAGRSAPIEGGPLTPANGSPSPRWEHLPSNRSMDGNSLYQMVYDARDGYVLLYGGYNFSPVGALNESWKFTLAGGWVELHPNGSPPYLTQFSMAYDSEDGYVLLFGGFKVYSGGLSNQTWKYAADHWTMISTPPAPPARYQSVMVDDTHDGYVLLFGGMNVGGFAINDTWSYRNGTWTQIAPYHGVAPPTRSDSQMAYDAHDGYALLFGGIGGSGGFLQDTWTYSNRNWTELHPSTVPGALSSAAMQYDPATGYVLLFGGSNQSNDMNLNGSWAYRGGDWSRLTSTTAPSARGDDALAYSGRGGFLLLYGGTDTFGNNLADGWAWAAPTVNLTAGPSAIDMGQSANLTAVADSPAGEILYNWSAVPGALGCSGPAGAVVSCTPDRTGNLTAALLVTDADGASNSTTTNLTVFADPTVTPPQPAATAGEVSEPITFTTQPAGGSGNYTQYRWTGPPLGACPATVTSVPSVTCTFGGAANYTLAVAVTDSLGFTSSPSGAVTFRVFAGLSVGTPAAIPATADLGGHIGLTVSPSGGDGVYAAYLWSNLTFGTCFGTTTDQVVCSSDRTGSYAISVHVTDALGFSATSAAVTVVVDTDPALAPVVANRAVTDAGSQLTLSTNVSGGAPPWNYQWTGLPVGCATVDSLTVSCLFGSPGSFTIGARALDGNGFHAEATPLTVVVNPALELASFVSLPSRPTVGSNLTLGSFVTGGTTPFSYSYANLPPGCPNSNSSRLHCHPDQIGTYSVQLTVTDGAGVHAVATIAVQVVAATPPSGTAGSPSRSTDLLIGAGLAAVAIVAFALITVVRRRRRRSPER